MFEIAGGILLAWFGLCLLGVIVMKLEEPKTDRFKLGEKPFRSDFPPIG